ncbi:hypothetical protein BZA77DRAFT_266223 [Pyronema omphalodes]|nr:hypothetical protein BZA77DRAFT_266223 [Pyronema omphalodes]
MMSSRIHRQSMRSSQRSRHSMLVTGDDAFSFALRVAYLHYLLTPRPRRHGASSSISYNPAAAAAASPQMLTPGSRLSTGTFQDLIADFSRVSYGSSSSKDTKGCRFPKGFLPVLKERTQAVLMGQDKMVEYKDATVKRTFGSFYGALVEPRYYENTAKSRRPEDLLLIFYTHATKELQKVHGGGGAQGDWKQMVDRHVALFVRLMGRVIKEEGWASSNPELVARLEMMEKKLLRHEDMGDGQGVAVTATQEPLSGKVEDMPMVKTVSRVFNVPLETCQKDIDAKKAVWTEKSAFNDMKQYMNNLNLSSGSTLRRDDFDMEEAWEAWVKKERTEVSENILTMGRAHAELLVGTAKRHGHTPSMGSGDFSGPGNRISVYDPNMEIGKNGEEEEEEYVFIPPDPRAFFRQIVARCLVTDLGDPEMELEIIDIPGAEPVALLAKSSMELLNACASRWRLPKYSRMVVFLDAFRTKYQEGELRLLTLESAFAYFEYMISEFPPHMWTIADQNQFRQLLSSVHDFVLRELYDILQHAYSPEAESIGLPLWVLDTYIYKNEMFTRVDIDEYCETLKDGLRQKAEEVWGEMFEDHIMANKKEGETIDPIHILNLMKEVDGMVDKVQKRFNKKILGHVSPTRIFVEVVYPKLALKVKSVLEETFAELAARKQEMALDDGLDIYRQFTDLRALYMGLKNMPEEWPVHIEDLFIQFPKRWLQEVDSKVLGWVEGAVKQDKQMFSATEGPDLTERQERHTSSVVDIFRSFNQSIGFLKELNWQDEYQYAKFMTVMTKILEKGVTRYCEELEYWFRHELNKKTPEQEAALTQTKQQKWMAMAKEAWSNEKKVEPFQFAPESCLKLNNIEFAQTMFDRLESSINADALAEVIARHEPVQRGPKRSVYVFTVKIMEAEDLKAMDISGYSDPYVVLGDEFHHRLAKTRIVYSNLNPRWEESFDITTGGPILLVATLWDWDTMGDHDCLGRASLKLDPQAFMDFLPKEIWLDLDTQGRLLLRISMEGERDDIQFHFGKAFRTLKRTERDMTRQITDKLSAYIHHCLSRAALKNVLSKGTSTMSAMTNLFSRTGLGNRPPSVAAVITDADIASALLPLTEYFNENFAILNQTLTPTAMTLVMTKLWKEVLVTLESLMVPTLSEKPSNQKPLSPKEAEIITRWLQLLLDFFHAKDEYTGEATGVPMEQLKNTKYHELQTLQFFYFEKTEDLVRSSERIANSIAARQQQKRQAALSSGGSGLSSLSAAAATTGSGSNSGFLTVSNGVVRQKSVLNKRNLSTIRKVKEEKRKLEQAEPNDDMILRILRMRPEAAGYLRDRARQKEKIESIAAMDAIVAKSLGGGQKRVTTGLVQRGR